jgi:hypothetical protein
LRVYTRNDPLTEAAILSAENAGLNLDNILFVVIDAPPPPDGAIQSGVDGRIDVTYLYPIGGAQAIDYTLQILERGENPPAEVVLETKEGQHRGVAREIKRMGGAIGAAAAVGLGGLCQPTLSPSPVSLTPSTSSRVGRGAFFGVVVGRCRRC